LAAKVNRKLLSPLPAHLIFVSFFAFLFFIRPFVSAAGPQGEKAFFRLESQTTAPELGDEITVKIILDTCAGSTCADVSAADIEIAYDPTQLLPLSSQAETGSIFSNYFLNTVSNGRIYIAAFNIPPAVYNSFGNIGDPQTFARIKFKVLAPNGPISLVINGTDATNDSTGVYLAASAADILDQSQATANGNLNLNVVAPTPTPPLPPLAYPASISLLAQTPPPFSVTVGDTFEIEIWISTGDLPTVGVDAILNYDPSLLEVIRIAENPDLYPEFPQKEISAGTIKISGYSTQAPFFSGYGKLAAISFKALSGGTAVLGLDYQGQGVTTDSNVSFFSPTPVDTDNGPRDLLGTAYGLEVYIEEPVPTPTLLPTATPTFIPTSTPTPLPPLPTLIPIACHYNANLDLDLRGSVDSADLSILVYWWGKNPLNLCPSPDLNHDNAVNSLDIQVFVSYLT